MVLIHGIFPIDITSEVILCIALVTCKWHSRAPFLSVRHAFGTHKICDWKNYQATFLWDIVSWLQQLCRLLNVSSGINNLLNDMSISKCKKDVAPLLTHWSYVFLALTNQYTHCSAYPHTLVCTINKRKWNGISIISMAWDKTVVTPVLYH